eukprot:GHVH01004503.1.p1 GENE.GHVH01004503.1~~GHVH01004503.1.p1  ORF type:complete len:741 (+),score=102.44 GHVH01004503.1:58-2280(+)
MSITLRCGKLPSQDLAYTNTAFVNPSDFESIRSMAQTPPSKNEVLCMIRNGVVMSVSPLDQIPIGIIAANGHQRKTARLGLDDEIALKPFNETVHVIESACILVAPLKGTTGSIKDCDLTVELTKQFSKQVFISGQKFVAIVSGLALDIQIEPGKMFGNGKKSIIYGRFDINAQIEYTCDSSSGLQIKQTMMQADKLFDTSFNFESLGIGGLDAEFQDIFRRAFASRVHPPHILEELGITHVKGMILHGPPGTGKTLIARQIGHALKCEEPKVVNGPEILNKYVGQSEENVRNLFKEAEEEQKKKGDCSKLHIIIFDELDAICKQRGSVAGGTGTNDSIVNQLLSKIDGVDALNNILIIGMTNRLDMIDEALLRPGRFECHIEIGLPDEKGRQQILRIHTMSMSKAGRLGKDVDLDWLATQTKNFSGAELAGLCRSAASYALSREIDFNDLSKAHNIDAIKIAKGDFDHALQEVHAGYGADEEALELRFRNGIIQFSKEFITVKESVEAIIKQQRDYTKTPIFSTLLAGIHGSGKTALACYLAAHSGYPFVKLISPDDDKLVGTTEYSKINFINKVFNDAYKSTLSLIVIDDLERLIDYTPIGPRFSNTVLQTLIVLIRKAPKKEGRRLCVIATTSEENFLHDVDLTTSFQALYQVPAVKSGSQLRRILQSSTKGMRSSDIDETVHQVEELCETTGHVLGVKQIHSAMDMAYAGGGGSISSSGLMSALKDVGLGRSGRSV